MLAAGRQQLRRRSVWQLSAHCVHHHRSNRPSSSARLVSLPRPKPDASSESTGALWALLTAMGVVQVYSNPLLGSIDSANFIARHFETSKLRAKQGYLHTLVTSTLFTPNADHAVLNMMWLAISGRHVCRALGEARFLALFFGSGTLANLVSMSFGTEEVHDAMIPKFMMPGGGSCAAVDCVVTLNALLYPPSRVAISRRWMRWPLWFFSWSFLTRDEPWRERPPWEMVIASREAHATGILCGLATFLVLWR
ncbi:hypothetical protein PHYBOEH_009383 [Phytophthora boehmeriae]|uniref:Peptidase S54 rhomboid domain-containing protein n=1 Tax=Phytophthora boehmeriae TaxID=109152 RepID=A0A8T1WZ89_9STRA|nr:hypothetical protein PHYBOEH_009383 [Phytophthora boehmeriae]